ncbi:MAG: hypothetical protein ACJ0BR_04935 [Candidatus Puniceispirillales bacterium]
MSFKYFKIIIAIILKIFFFISISFASINEDCQNSSFYIENISVDLTKESINEARLQAENKAKLLGINRLINRLIIKKNNLKFKKNEISILINYLKINKEANSDKRYLANFDICFNRNLVINFFRKNKLKYSETYREPISILPIFKGPRGFVLWDEKDKWYKKWKNQIKLVDGLVKLKLAQGNFQLNRTISANVLLNSDKNLINKIIKNEKTNALLVVIAEPILRANGKTYLTTYAKHYKLDGKLVNTVYRNKTPLKKISSIYDVDENLIEKEILKIIASIEKKWKQNNLIDTSILNEVDLVIPITSIMSTTLENKLLFNDKTVNVQSTQGFSEKGLLKIQNESIFYKNKTLKSFNNITRNIFNSSSQLKYEKNIPVSQKDIRVWPMVLKKLEKLPFVIEVKVVSITNLEGRIIVKFMGNKKTFFQAVNEKKLIFENLNSRQYVLVN